MMTKREVGVVLMLGVVTTCGYALGHTFGIATGLLIGALSIAAAGLIE